MKSFEKHIKERKGTLDTERVTPEVWLAIENKMLKKKNRATMTVIRWVIGAVAACGLALMVFKIFDDPSTSAQDLLAQHGIESQGFIKEVSLKKAALKDVKIPENRQEDFEMLTKQLNFLDNQYQDYLQYVEMNGYQEFIGQQIINYYKMKIDLLEKIQVEIEKINSYEQKYNQTGPKVGLSI